MPYNTNKFNLFPYLAGCFVLVGTSISIIDYSIFITIIVDKQMVFFISADISLLESAKRVWEGRYCPMASTQIVASMIKHNLKTVSTSESPLLLELYPIN